MGVCLVILEGRCGYDDFGFLPLPILISIFETRDGQKATAHQKDTPQPRPMQGDSSIIKAFPIRIVMSFATTRQCFGVARAYV